MSSNNPGLLAYQFDLHHIFPREVLEFYGERLDELFGGKEHNPFNLDANTNKILAPQRAAFANALRLLAEENPAARAAFGDLGANEHGAHQRYNDFVKDLFETIFETGPDALSSDQKKLALAKLHMFGADMISTGFPPLTSSTYAEFTAAFLKGDTLDGKLTSSDAQASTYLGNKQLEHLSTPLEDRFTDVGNPSGNPEGRAFKVVQLLESIINSDTVTQDMKDLMVRQVVLIENGWLAPETVSLIARQALTEVSKTTGIGNNDGVYPDLTADTLQTRPPQTPDPVFMRGAETLVSNTEAANRPSANSPDVADGVADDLRTRLDGASEAARTMADRLGPTINEFMPDSVVHTNQLNLNFDRMIDATAKHLASVRGAASADEFGHALRRMTDALGELGRQVNDTLKDMPGGRVLSQLGALGDLYEFSQVAGQAWDQYRAGDTSGAIATLVDGAAKFVTITAVSMVAATGLAIMGAPGAAVVATALLVSIQAEKAWEALFPEGLLGSEADPKWNEDTQELYDLIPMDPIVVDLDGDGVELISLDDSQTYFDLDGDGFKEHTGWVSADDGFLVYDANGNGQIDDINEHMGHVGRGGFDELADFDSDQNGVMNSNDARFSDLSIWQDLNGNGITDDGELKSLSAHGIAEVSLNYSRVGGMIEGNVDRGSTTVTFTDGTTGKASEILFDLSQSRTQFILPENFEPDIDVLSLPYLRGFGEITNSWVGMSMDAGLKTAAQDLVQAVNDGDFATFDNDFNSFLYRWAGTQNAKWISDAGPLRYIYLYDEEDKLPAFADPADYLPEIPDFFIIDLVGVDRQFEFTPGFYGEYLPGEAILEVAAQNDVFVPVHGQFAYYTATMSVKNAGLGGGTSVLLPPPSVNIVDETPEFDPVLTLSTGSFSIADEPYVPAMAPQSFAFIQASMGQPYTSTIIAGRNHVAHSDLITHTPDEETIAEFAAIFDNTVKYYQSRFLVQSAALAKIQGIVGAASLFEPLSYSSLTDQIYGNTKAFVSNVLGHFNNDLDALEMLSKFGPEFNYLGALIAAEDTTLDRSALTSLFGMEQLVEGTAQGDSLTGAANSNLVGHQGDDVLTGTGGGTVYLGGAGNDTLNGSDGPDTYVYRKGDGSDVIFDSTTRYTVRNDKFVFVDATIEDVTFSNAGNDLVMAFESGETITIDNHFEHSRRSAMDAIQFMDGMVISYQGIRDKTVSDMKASGTVVGTTHTENYFHLLGDGSYTISENNAQHHSNQLFFLNLNADEVVFEKNASNDLVITMSNGETVTIKDHFQSYLHEMQGIAFADGVLLDQQGIRDKVVADLKPTGSVVGTNAAEHYLHATGEGSYTISDFGTQAGTLDRLTFVDLNQDDVTFTQNSGSDLVITTSAGEVITVKDHFLNSYYDMEEIGFADGTLLGLNEISAKYVSDSATAGNDSIAGTYYQDTLYGGLGNDTLRGDNGADLYLYSLGDGTDLVRDYSTSGSQIDEVRFVDVLQDDVTFSQNSGQDLVITMSDGGSVRVLDHFASSYYDMEKISFSDGTELNAAGIFAKYIANSSTTGNDSILGSYTTDTISGGLGDDTLRGDNGADLYLYSLGDGADLVRDYSTSGSQIDEVRFVDVLLDDVTFSQNSGQDLVITMSDGGSVRVLDHFASSYYDMEKISFSDGIELNAAGIFAKYVTDSATIGNDSILGSYTSDTLFGGLGDDTLRGDSGADTYVYNFGDGSDVIFDYGTSSSHKDTLNFVDVLMSEVQLSQNSGQDLVISLSDGGSVTITDHFAHSYYDMEQIIFSGGSVMSFTDIMAKYVSDSATDGDDSITGSFTSDILYGGLGNDTLKGDRGADNYLYSFGDGDDLIQDYSSSSAQKDVLIFNDLTVSEVSLSQDAGDNLIIDIQGGGSVTIEDHFVNSFTDLERIEFSDGTVWTEADIAANWTWLT